MNKISLQIKKIISFFKNKWFKYVIEPKKRRKELNDKLNELKNLKANFEKHFGVSVDAVKKQINQNNRANGFEFKQTDYDYLTETLIQGKKHIIQSTCGKKSPLFYEPEICDIHNENPDRMGYPNMKDISEHNYNIVKKLFEQQDNSKVLNDKNKKKALIRWITRV